jgi:GNAT superfamily N-acetyltransferase
VTRPAQPSDATAIDAAGYEGALHHFRAAPSLLAEPAPSREWSESALAASAQSVCLVADGDGQVVGYVHAVVVEESRPIFVAHRYGRIEAVSVLPRYRARGIASALLTSAEQWLAKQGCRVARLSVFAFNDEASALHARRGYEPLVTFVQRNLDDRA